MRVRKNCASRCIPISSSRSNEGSASSGTESAENCRSSSSMVRATSSVCIPWSWARMIACTKNSSACSRAAICLSNSVMSEARHESDQRAKGHGAIFHFNSHGLTPYVAMAVPGGFGNVPGSAVCRAFYGGTVAPVGSAIRTRRPDTLSHVGGNRPRAVQPILWRSPRYRQCRLSRHKARRAFRGARTPRYLPVELGARGISARRLFQITGSAGRVAVIARHLLRRPATRPLLICLSNSPAGTVPLAGLLHGAGA